ncbi:M23 family metallopeptidase [Leucobacter sp. HNU]|uniref:M23 family metallopeptidase n=1 Tax=Leucobacter sp. HNU TaxID=3236805 RepID=UPI003A7FAD54
MGLSVNDQTIAVMTAIGESTLRILNYGDEAGPDSRGLFQQRDNWGPLADRMDAKKSATLFYNALIKIDENDRKTLPPSIVAHRVQINANPYHYEPFWKPAQEIVKALTDGKSGGSSCSAGPNPGGSTSISKKGWAAPSRGPITSAYGGRDGKFHSGVDLSGGGCGGPIWAAYPGAVSYVGLDDLNNGVIYIIHEGKLETRYVHMFPSQIYVRAGQKVKAGQQIAAVGASGQAFGCHLHFEVKEVRGITDWSGFHDPIPFLRERGITF